MERRRFVTINSLLLGGVVIVSNGLITISCETNVESEKSSIDIKLLNELGEIIIPSSSTPGAKEANVGEYISQIVQDCFSEKEQEGFNLNISTINNTSHRLFGQSFLECTYKQRHQLVQKLDDSDPGFKSLKELITSAFLSSEVGMNQFLTYHQVPGKYVGCTETRPW
ncbi:gluconate 2-dehydrogenase subunit 3 family protein [Membranihabitans maritimus]|uniref:gluconate 2-dehydrogenase subunit 3 family protein n=1 Tax=Membranihabitans maritimus TaxID=2904244 RepID=UPI001F2DB530|nr:gluconate 2-dehydrogenase subunit 3 family protein [Membranihabitans maritimus]